MTTALLPSSEQWGHHSPGIKPNEIIEAMVSETESALSSYFVLPEGPEPCRDRAGYFRVSVTIPMPITLFDQLMNGATGYRAHYSVSVEAGEEFNRRLVEAVAPMIVSYEQLYSDQFTHFLCRSSLLGSFSKFWYPKELTDPSAQDELLKLEEELRIPKWVQYWSLMDMPRKGLLAPIPESHSILLNGTFVDKVGTPYEQKPNRSKQIFDTGWT